MRDTRKANFAGTSLSLLLIIIVVFAPNLQAQISKHAKVLAKPFPKTQYIPQRSYDTKHIKLNLSFDWDKETVKGTAEITFSPLRANLEQVEFDAANMSFSSVKLENSKPPKYKDDKKEPYKSLQFVDDDRNEKLRIKLDKTYQIEDTIKVIIEYKTDGPSNTSVKPTFAGDGGLVFVKPKNRTEARQIWSQGEAEFNHYWFPCYDHPNDFTTTEMVATVEKPYTVVSNGRLLEEKDNTDGTRTFHWKIDQPHATYLISVVVGEFVIIEDRSAGNIPVISYVPKDRVNEGRLTVQRVPKMVDYFEEYTGVKYPNSKYGQVFAKNFSGGMENISATTLSDTSILDERTMIDETSDALLSHELAHTWFGNYVTCRSWSEIWLNESFATYFEQIWDEQNLGRDEALYRNLYLNQQSYFNTWNGGTRRPIVTKNYTNPDAVFDTYAYPRGAAVLHTLRKYLGEDDWRRAINHYLKKHAHQPVQTEEFRIAIEEATGQPLEWFFDQWLYKMGHPVFDVTQNYDAKNKKLTLTVRQTQKPDPAFSYPQVEYFQTPVEIELAVSNGFLMKEIFIEPKAEQSFVFDVDEKPQFVNFDYESTLIKELKFVKPLGEWIAQTQRDRDVLGRLNAVKEIQKIFTRAMAGEKDKIKQALIEVAQNDKFWAVRKEAVETLRNVEGNDVRNALLNAVKDKNSLVRASAVNSLSANNDGSLANIYLQLLNDRSYTVVEESALALGKTKNALAYDALMKLYEMPSWQDRTKLAALQGLAELGDARALELSFRLRDSENKSLRNEALNLIARVGAKDVKAFDLLSNMFAKAIEEKNENLASAVIDAVVSAKDKRAIPLMEKMLQLTTDHNAKELLKNQIKELRKGK